MNVYRGLVAYNHVFALTLLWRWLICWLTCIMTQHFAVFKVVGVTRAAIIVCCSHWAFSGPFVVMVTRIVRDVFKFFFLYLIIFVPYGKPADILHYSLCHSIQALLACSMCELRLSGIVLWTATALCANRDSHWFEMEISILWSSQNSDCYDLVPLRIHAVCEARQICQSNQLSSYFADAYATEMLYL